MKEMLKQQEFCANKIVTIHEIKQSKKTSKTSIFELSHAEIFKLLLTITISINM